MPVLPDVGSTRVVTPADIGTFAQTSLLIIWKGIQAIYAGSNDHKLKCDLV